jgi:FixJ family two-component response regulator
MSGAELQELLLSAGRRLPIIFITAHPEDRIRDRVLAAGAVGFLGKPFAAQELVRCLDEALPRPYTASENL